MREDRNSHPDPWVRLQLLKSCMDLWDEERRAGCAKLSPIIPLTLFQRAQGPPYMTEPVKFADVFDEEFREQSWMPRFEHLMGRGSRA